VSWDSPCVGSPVEESNSDQKWEYGFVTVTAQMTTANPGDYTSVTLHNDISAYEALLEAAPSGHCLKILHFSSSWASCTPDFLEEVDLSMVTVSNMQVYIIGWTLSCWTPGKAKKKKFTVQSGGL
jgi:hypothetical protein